MVVRDLDEIFCTIPRRRVPDHRDPIAQRVLGGVVQEIAKTTALENQGGAGECVRRASRIWFDGSAAEHRTDRFWSWKDLVAGRRRGDGRSWAIKVSRIALAEEVRRLLPLSFNIGLFLDGRTSRRPHG